MSLWQRHKKLTKTDFTFDSERRVNKLRNLSGCTGYRSSFSTVFYCYQDNAKMPTVRCTLVVQKLTKVYVYLITYLLSLWMDKWSSYGLWCKQRRGVERNWTSKESFMRQHPSQQLFFNDFFFRTHFCSKIFYKKKQENSKMKNYAT